MMNSIETLLASAFAAFRDISPPIEAIGPEGRSFEMEMQLAEEVPAPSESDSPEEEAEQPEAMAEPDLVPALPLAAIPAAPVIPAAGGDQPVEEAAAPDEGASPAPPVAEGEGRLPDPAVVPVPRHVDPVSLAALWSGEIPLLPREGIAADVPAVGPAETLGVDGGDAADVQLAAGQAIPATAIRSTAPALPVAPLPSELAQIPSRPEKTPDLADEWARLVGQGRLASQRPGGEGTAMPLPMPAPVPATPVPRPSREPDPVAAVEAAVPAGKPEASIPPVAVTPPAAVGSLAAIATEEQSTVESGLVAEVAIHFPPDRQAEGAGRVVLHAPALQVEPRHIIRQLSERIPDAPQNQIEITLSPEELGKVRLVITQGDSPTVTVHAENRDTLDLLRRNGELLARELRDTGLGGATISFGDRGAGAGTMQQPDRLRYGPDRPREGEDPTITATTQYRPVQGRQIDIRI